MSNSLPVTSQVKKNFSNVEVLRNLNVDQQSKFITLSPEESDKLLVRYSQFRQKLIDQYVSLPPDQRLEMARRNCHTAAGRWEINGLNSKGVKFIDLSVMMDPDQPYSKEFIATLVLVNDLLLDPEQIAILNKKNPEKVKNLKQDEEGTITLNNLPLNLFLAPVDGQQQDDLPD